MTQKEQQAYDYFSGGYNCAQSVFAAFHEEMGLDEELALKLMMPMGGGVARLREICGAVTGAAMALGMLRDVKPDDRAAKFAIYDQVQKKIAVFKQQYGSVICRDLINLRGDDPEKTYSCADYVRFCARLVEEELENR